MVSGVLVLALIVGGAGEKKEGSWGIYFVGETADVTDSVGYSLLHLRGALFFATHWLLLPFLGACCALG